MFENLEEQDSYRRFESTLNSIGSSLLLPAKQRKEDGLGSPWSNTQRIYVRVKERVLFDPKSHQRPLQDRCLRIVHGERASI